MPLKIYATQTPSTADVDFLQKGIYEEALREKGMRPIIPFGFFLKDANGKTVGGVNGFCYYGCLFMDQLYIEEKYRGLGWGTKLVATALDFGSAQNCTFSTVTTMDWEARGFYEKLGYKVIMDIEGYDNNSKMHVLRKE